VTRIGYVPYSKDLRHPADRRRLATWASEKKIELNITNPLDSDVLVLSNAANFGYWLKRAKQPVVLDLVDGYLGESPSFLKDAVRNLSRSIQGLSSFHWLTYSRHLRYACKKSNTIVVASLEQRDLILKLNRNVQVILDDHSEIETRVAKSSLQKSVHSSPTIFWEGFGYTLKHFGFMASELDHFLEDSKWKLCLVTVAEFPRWGGFVGKVKTEKMVKALFPKSWESIRVIPWTLDNLTEYASKSSFAIIPISPSDKFANFKSENKLLSLWRLQLPVLTSTTPSYQRVLKSAGNSDACVDEGEWYAKLKSLANSQSKQREFATSGVNYILMNHTHSQLVEKWDEVVSFALSRDK